MEGINMRQLTLTDAQFAYLYEYLREVVEYLEGEMDTTKDYNGAEILEDITQYEAYQIFQQIKTIKGV